MKLIFSLTLLNLFFLAAQAQEKKGISPFVNSSKVAVTFPDIREGHIAIQIGAGQYEVLPFIMEQGHAYARSCETELKKVCKADGLKNMLDKTQREISDKCAEIDGESRIAKRFGVKKITSVCYFKEDKSFVEIN